MIFCNTCQEFGIGIVKTAHTGYPKKFLQDSVHNKPAGSYLSLLTKYDGVYLIAMGYKYNKKTVTYFIATLGAGTTSYSNRPYIQKYTDDFGNLCEKTVLRNDLASFYFQFSNVIDVHNNERQFQLRLEKKWRTNDPFFRVSTTLVAFSVIDAYKLYKFNNPVKNTHFTVLQFANILAGQLIQSRNLIRENINNNKLIRRHNIIQYSFTDKDGDVHTLQRNDHVRVSKKSGKLYRAARDCVMCKLTHRRTQTVFFCTRCNVPLCSDVFRFKRNNSSQKRCFELWHARLSSHTRSYNEDKNQDLTSYEEIEPEVGAFDFI